MSEPARNSEPLPRFKLEKGDLVTINVENLHQRIIWLMTRVGHREVINRHLRELKFYTGSVGTVLRTKVGHYLNQQDSTEHEVRYVTVIWPSPTGTHVHRASDLILLQKGRPTPRRKTKSRSRRRRR